MSIYANMHSKQRTFSKNSHAWKSFVQIFVIPFLEILGEARRCYYEYYHPLLDYRVLDSRDMPWVAALS
jgi:hypothetical protein